MNIPRFSKMLVLYPLAALSIMQSGSAKAQTSGDYGGFEWEQIGDIAEIYGYDGPGGDVIIPSSIPDTYGTLSIRSNLDGTVAGLGPIPANSTTLPVTIIGDGEDTVFNSDVTSVTIPDSVTNIGDYAFYECTGLPSLTIPGSVINIGDSAFELCTGLTIITMANNAAVIGREASGQIPEMTPPPTTQHRQRHWE
jgi:hypothetical protein